jgi:hypothetical protein
MLRPRYQYRLLTVAFLFALVGVAFFAGGLGIRKSLVQDNLLVYQFTNDKSKSNTPQSTDPNTFWKRFATDPLVIVTFCLVLGTVALAYFTYRLYRATAGLLMHVPKIERAYVSGGGGRNAADLSEFVLQMDNYGKTPAILQSYAIVITDLVTVKSNKPEYLSAKFTPIPLINRVPPQARAHTITTKPIRADLIDPVAYGRFWYKDIWDEEVHIFSFILPLNESANHRAVTGLDPEYTKWT